MKKSWLAACVVMFTAWFITGCDWEGGGEDDGWNSSSVNIDFSGVYRAPALTGGYVVTLNSGSQIISDETTIGTGNGDNKGFSGTLHAPVRAGSVVVQAGGVVLSDASGTNGVLAGAGGSGSIAYESGAIGVTFNTAPPIGTPVVVRYGYGSVHSSGASAGITSLTVAQTGNRLHITDNNGDTYTGVLGSGQVTSRQQTSETTQQIGEVYQFTAEGTSRGTPVKMVGTFEAQMTVYFTQEVTVDPNTGTMSQQINELYRTGSFSVNGTWIEPNRTGQIYGEGPQNERITVIQ